KPIQEKHLLAKKNGSTPTKETYKVRIEYRNDESINPSDLDDTDKTFYFKFSVNYVQADDTAIDSHPSAIHYITRQNEGQITPGDVIGIGETEDFYVISSNAEKTVLLAKYNLLVGNESDDWGNTFTPIPTTAQGYGLQSVDAIGYGNHESFKGTVPFSSTNYWMNGNNLISSYNENDTIYLDNSDEGEWNWHFKYRNDDSDAYPYVYDNTLTTAPDFSSECDDSTNCYNTPGYSIAYYVEEYKTKLIEMGAPSTISGRLLTYEEADAAKTIEDNSKSIIFDEYQSYWLGSASDVNHLRVVYSFGSSFDYGSYDSRYYYFGVRPVIEISTSDI
ncbi:MAG: hypothetical protein IK997_04170, partial [Bacilli bacterium]|nr:hypothetical protein [Bacilli bacterium]